MEQRPKGTEADVENLGGFLSAEFLVIEERQSRSLSRR
jgi:hypothetical protein